jgi:hypothetical protein
MKRLIILALACALVPAAAAQLYKYVDKDGKTVYSDQPPLNTESKQIVVQPGPAKAGPRSYVQEDKELTKSRDAAKEKAKKAEQAERDAKEAEARCAQAQSNYQVYVDGGRITKYVNGERIFLGDDEIAAERERSKRELDEACKK